MKRQKENKKTKDKRSGWLVEVVHFIINLFPIIIISIIILISCTSQSQEGKLEKEVKNRLEELFDDPTVLDNKSRNGELIKTFQDSGAYNNKSQKIGIWVEYKIEHKFGNIPITVVSNSGDSSQIQWTDIVKYCGEYEDGYKVSNWKRYVLTSKVKPYEWEEKEK